MTKPPGNTAPDGSAYITLTDGQGNLVTPGNMTIGQTQISGGTNGLFLYDNAGIVGEKAGGSGLTIGTTTVTGGATTQVLFNLAGVVSSDSGFTYAGSGGQLQLNSNGILTSPAAATWQFGAATSASPVAQTLQFQGTATTNTAGVNSTIIGSLSAGSGNSGDIIFQTGVKSGVSGTPATATTALTIKGETQIAVFSPVSSTITSVQVARGSVSTPAYSFSGADATNGLWYGLFAGLGVNGIQVSVNGVQWGVGSNQVGTVQIGPVQFAANASGNFGTVDLAVGRDAANILAQVNGTNAQSFRVYNTSSSSNSNYERGVFGWTDTGNVLTIGTQMLGTGVARNLQFVVGGVNKLDYGITSTGKWSFTGDVSANGQVLSTSNVQVGSTGDLYFLNRTNIFSPADGVLELTNNAITDFGRLQFGGTTSSFPAIKRSSATLAFRLADDSADCNISSAVLSTSTSGGVGYATGAGGTVTQGAGSGKATAVTLNKTTGQITMNNANLAGQTEVSFTLTNSSIAATDVVVVSIASGATANSYVVGVAATAAGSCVIQLGNVTLATTLGEAVVLNFVVIKGVTS